MKKLLTALVIVLSLSLAAAGPVFSAETKAEPAAEKKADAKKDEKKAEAKKDEKKAKKAEPKKDEKKAEPKKEEKKQ